MQDLVLSRATRCEFRVLSTHAFNNDLFNATDSLTMFQNRRVIEHNLQTLVSFDCHGFVNEFVGHLSGLRAWSWRKDK
jgi:hypothetical protein